MSENMRRRYHEKLGDYVFEVKDFFPKPLFDLITDVRVNKSKVIEDAAKIRKRRETLTRDGKLTILATDHAARMVTRVGDNPVAIASRYEFLGRILRVITSPEFDGVMGTPDILEDLLIVDYLVQEHGGESFLAEKVMLGCLNRGGLLGATFELDDRFTAFTPKSIKELRFDGAKFMFRLDLSNPDAGKTIYYVAQAINECNKYDLPVFLEALPVVMKEGRYSTKRSAEDIAKVVGVATALGDSSRNIWLKIPYCENYEMVASATTCPILMLGGPSRGDPTYTIEDFAKGKGAGKNVRGALVGRNVHFPGREDPQAVALAINSIFHKGYSAEEAIESMAENRAKNMDFLNKHFRS